MSVATPEKAHLIRHERIFGVGMVRTIARASAGRLGRAYQGQEIYPLPLRVGKTGRRDQSLRVTEEPGRTILKLTVVAGGRSLS